MAQQPAPTGKHPRRQAHLGHAGPSAPQLAAPALGSARATVPRAISFRQLQPGCGGCAEPGEPGTLWQGWPGCRASRPPIAGRTAPMSAPALARPLRLKSSAQEVRWQLLLLSWLNSRCR